MVKGAGVIAYTIEGYVLIAYQNVNTWSFPKGHRDGKEPWIHTAAREFQEETNLPKEKVDEIQSKLSDEMKTNTDGVAYLYFYKISPEEIELLRPDGVEIRALKWIHIDELDQFRTVHPVNKTISNLDIQKFKEKTGVMTKEQLLQLLQQQFIQQQLQQQRQQRPLNPGANAFTPSNYAYARRKSKKSMRKSKKVRKSARKSKKVRKSARKY